MEVGVRQSRGAASEGGGRESLAAVGLQLVVVCVCGGCVVVVAVGVVVVVVVWYVTAASGVSASGSRAAAVAVVAVADTLDWRRPVSEVGTESVVQQVRRLVGVAPSGAAEHGVCGWQVRCWRRRWRQLRWSKDNRRTAGVEGAVVSGASKRWWCLPRLHAVQRASLQRAGATDCADPRAAKPVPSATANHSQRCREEAR